MYCCVHNIIKKGCIFEYIWVVSPYGVNSKGHRECNLCYNPRHCWHNFMTSSLSCSWLKFQFYLLSSLSLPSNHVARVFTSFNSIGLFFLTSRVSLNLKYHSILRSIPRTHRIIRSTNLHPNIWPTLDNDPQIVGSLFFLPITDSNMMVNRPTLLLLLSIICLNMVVNHSILWTSDASCTKIHHSKGMNFQL